MRERERQRQRQRQRDRERQKQRDRDREREGGRVNGHWADLVLKTKRLYITIVPFMG